MTSLTKFVNLMASGGLSRDLAPFLFSATLHVAIKKEGGYRPIAVGEVLRRLTSKCRAFVHLSAAAEYLNPLQVGVGTRSSGEASIYVVQAVLSDPTIPANQKWVLKVDYSNAFNTIDWENMFEEVRQHFHGLTSFVEWCYGPNPTSTMEVISS